MDEHIVTTAVVLYRIEKQKLLEREKERKKIASISDPKSNV